MRAVSRAATLALALALAALATADSVRAETRPRYGLSLTASLLGKPAVYDPHVATSHAELTIAGLIFDSLYRVEPTGDIVPELASSMPVLSDDRLEVTIEVRVGAFFHDNKTLVAADVVASLVRLKAGRAGWLLASVETIEASEDRSSVVLRLRYPDPELALHLASPVAAITRAGKKPSSRRPIGTGPYRLRVVDRKKREMRFAAFEKHHRGRAYVDALRLRWHEKPDAEARAYEVGELHLSFRGDVAFTGHEPKYQTRSAEAGASILAYVGFGRSHAAVLADREFRRAVSLAISRKGMTNLGSGEKVVATVRPDSRAAGAPRARASAIGAQLKKARGALQVAAQRVPALANLERLNLEILVNRSRLDDIDIADKLLASLDKIGVQATVVEVSAEVFNKRVSRGACDFFIGQLLAPSHAGRSEIAAAFAAGRDDWARKALSRAPLDRVSAISEFRRRLPIIPLFHRAVRAHHRSDVYGLEFNGSAQIEWADLFRFGSPKTN